MSKQPESHYKIDKLHIIFAIATLSLLVIVGGVLMKDYDRTWKDYQKQFRTYEIEVARTKYNEEINKLENDPEYQELLAKYEDAKKEYDEKCNKDQDLENTITELKTQKILKEQKLKYTNAERDAAKFRYENAVGHHVGDPKATKEEYQALAEEAKSLKYAVENVTVDLNNATEKKLQCSQKITSLKREKRLLASKADIIQRKLDTIDPNEMDFTNRIAQMVRDLPILDLSTPTTEVKQIVLEDITDDLIIRQVPKVDRCITCHLGIDDPAYEDFPQPYTTHPNLEQYVDKDSPHPMEEFGCTTCHGGRGRATSFQSAVHTPQNAEQKKEWEEKYDWKTDHHWENPMYPLQFTQAGCFKCHSGEFPIKGAEELNLGLNIIEKAGCYACHEIDRYKDWPKPGPDLTHIASKLSKNFAYKWIEDPHFFRKDTWMPAYFNLTNNSDLASQARSQQEIHAMVNFLFAQSKPFNNPEPSEKGDPLKGEELVSSLGCYACHRQEPLDTDHELTRDDIRRQHGPTLTGLASKTSKKWVYNWLKDPNRYHPETRMPNMRLSDEEASDITAFLFKDATHKTFEMKSVPGFDEDIITEITQDFMSRQMPKKEAESKITSMSLDEKLAFSGEKLISRYGCYSCHNISGFENAKPIGIALTEEGSKSLHKFDFGYVHIDHTKEAWFDQKLKAPRSFDKNKAKEPLEKLIMPSFKLSAHERDAVVTSLLGFVSDVTVKNKIKPRTPENLKLEAGQEIIAQMNCQSCHVIDGEGGTIQETITSWLKNHEGLSTSEAEKQTESFSPPNLLGTGIKIDAEWLFNFLHTPDTKVRPWLNVRMPSYTFNEDHLNTLVKYFNVLDGENNFPFHKQKDISLTDDEFEQAEKLFSQDYLGCNLCHVVGDEMPTGTKDTWAPDLVLAKTRLDPDWIIKWIKDPQSLVPGTSMPTFFDPNDYENAGPSDIMNGDEDEQIRILRNYLMSLSDKRSQNSSKNVKTPSKDAQPTPSEVVPDITATQ